MQHSKIIIALDHAELSQAKEFVNQLNPELCRLKIANNLYMQGGPELLNYFHNLGFEVFLDLKFHDIPHQVSGACYHAAKKGAWMLNVHASGGIEMLKAANKAVIAAAEKLNKPKPLLIGVTILTSLSQENLASIGFDTRNSVEQSAVKLAKLCKLAGLAGVVCSAHEVPAIKQSCGADFICVTPGIRVSEDSVDDQSRVMTPKKAIASGSDYLVIGRSVTHAKDPNQKLINILDTIS